MLTVVRYSLMRSFSTSALIDTTSAPEMPRTVFAASCTAASAAFAKLSADEPMIVMTFATSATFRLLGCQDHAVAADRVAALDVDLGAVDGLAGRSFVLLLPRELPR